MDLSAKLTVLAVLGDSGAAMMNAETVLDAKPTIEGALADANEALMEAQAALVGANEDQTTELNKVIGTIKMRIMEIDAILKGDDLEKYGETVTGTDPDEPKTAADAGLVVAKSIENALTRTGGFAISTTPNDIDTARMADPTMGAHKDDHQGMSWSDIFDVVDKRIATDAEVITVVPATSVDGTIMEGNVTAPFECDIAGTDRCADGSQDAGTFSGIVGTFFCEGGKCAVEGTGDAAKLTGGWYFYPTSSDDYYNYSHETKTYSVETLYAEYGYWLADATVTDIVTAVTINAYVRSDGNTTGLELGDTDEFKDDNSAEYNGPAVGLSSLGKGENLESSGHFDADVNLKVTFGGTPSIAGSISNFRGNAVNTKWEVELHGELSAQGVFSNGETDTVGGDDGTWSATLYGPVPVGDPPVNQRPTGIFGTFNANFSDGQAAGAYATRKE
jgi:hypothetical protein